MAGPIRFTGTREYDSATPLQSSRSKSSQGISSVERVEIFDMLFQIIKNMNSIMVESLAPFPNDPLPPEAMYESRDELFKAINA
jgi:hypothetical protein